MSGPLGKSEPTHYIHGVLNSLPHILWYGLYLHAYGPSLLDGHSIVNDAQGVISLLPLQFEATVRIDWLGGQE